MLFLAVRIGETAAGLRQFGIGLIALLIPALGIGWLQATTSPGRMIPTEVYLLVHILEVAALWLMARALRIFFGAGTAPLCVPLVVTFTAFLVTSIWQVFKGGVLDLTHLFFMLCWFFLLADMLRVLWRSRVHNPGVLLLGSTVSTLIILIVPNVLWPKLWQVPMPAGTDFFAAIFIPVATVSAIMFSVERMALTLGDTARSDPLTGILHEKSFHVQLEKSIAQAIYLREPLSLIRMELTDEAQQRRSAPLEETDQLLTTAVLAIRENVRGTDQLARLSGGEFAVLMEGSRLSDAIQVGERIVGGLSRTLPTGSVVHAGVVELRSPGETPDGLLYRARKALVTAQEKGPSEVVGA